MVGGSSNGNRIRRDSNDSDYGLSVNYSPIVYEKNNGHLLPSINSNVSSNHATSKTNNSNTLKLLMYINDNIIGKDFTINGPWGIRRMLYCDYIASGRALQFIEHFIKTTVLPLYGNTHSENSLCALQTSKFRDEARALIKKSVNATQDDVVIFTGSGTTGAIHRLITVTLSDKENTDNIVVMISAFEHHSNILPWKETGIEVIRIPTTNQGILDKNILKEKLQYYTNLKKKIICSFNAASNITGIRTDVESISTLVHTYNGLIFWDYATAAPYVKVDMNSSALGYKDAIFISVHKFIGGPGTPGVLVAKKHLFKNRIPGACGGGTVNYVTRTSHEYNKDIEVREEGGTPDIVGSIRAGLVFQLKDALGDSFIEAEENSLVKKFFKRFRKDDKLIVLGSRDVPRLAVFSFLIYVPSICKYLHHNFVSLLLNDLFGIQVRAGCACAGPYALDLLNIDNVKTKKFIMFMTDEPSRRVDQDNEKVEKTLMMRPGFCRVNLPYFAPEEEINFILDAIEFVANYGWKFLPLYTYEPVSGAWKHRGLYQPVCSSLEQITYRGGKMQQHGRKEQYDKVTHDPLREAKLIMQDALRRVDLIDYRIDPPLNISDKYKDLIWFALPLDIATMLAKQREGHEQRYNINDLPFIPQEAKQLNIQKHSNRGDIMDEKRSNDSNNRIKKHARISSQHNSNIHRSHAEQYQQS
ncbi:unnamed protein product [Didymodactylos carnosus]|nr:unnamed protein product [Didymodactylos carnosus]CAF3538355.1 unnamed protein product [Didymodactylos carnosus]